MKLRAASNGDAAAIMAIWNPVICDTAATFTSEEKTDAAIAGQIGQCAAEGRAFMVAEAPQGVVGFATYGPFRNGPGYARTMEHTIILAPQARGRGIGRMLMGEIEAHARDRGIHTLWAGISAENPDAVAFHARVGFVETARLPEVGRKFGRWMDLILMHRRL